VRTHGRSAGRGRDAAPQQRHQVDMDAAFTLLRASARNHNRPLVDLPRAVFEGSESV
jgi:hypothetical protein